MEHEITTARDDHRCIELNLSGQPCGLKAVAGRERCYIHGIYHALNDGRSTIDIPVLEDPKAILYVYSQVARALAQGAMPAANANGIIRCCKGAQRLLEEQWKRERFEERKRAKKDAQRRAQGSAAVSHPEPDHVDAAVLPNFDNCEDADDIAATEPAAAIPATRPAPDGNDASDQTSTLQAASCAEHEPASGEGSEPQPWNVEPSLPVVPPPQFADAPEKFKHAVERVGGQHLDALLRRDRAIRARGGSMSDFYEKRGQGVRCDVRDTYSTDSTPLQTSEPLSS